MDSETPPDHPPTADTHLDADIGAVREHLAHGLGDGLLAAVDRDEGVRVEAPVRKV